MEHLNIIFLIGIVWLIVALVSSWLNKEPKINPQKEIEDLKIQLQQAIIDKKQVEVNSEKLAIDLFNGYKEKEIYNVKNQLTELITAEFVHNFEIWKSKYSTEIRSKAIENSKSVILGKVTEHLAPFMSDDFTFNSKEARFIGSPVDLIVFDGMDEEKEEVYIRVIEIKTGDSALSKRQKLIKKAVDEKRISWHEIRVQSFRSTEEPFN